MNHDALLSWVDDRDELISWPWRKPPPLIEKYGKSNTLMTHISGKQNIVISFFVYTQIM